MSLLQDPKPAAAKTQIEKERAEALQPLSLSNIHLAPRGMFGTRRTEHSIDGCPIDPLDKWWVRRLADGISRGTFGHAHPMAWSHRLIWL
jgi:hypothetical protein